LCDVFFTALPEQMTKALVKISVATCFTRFTNRQSQTAVHSVLSALVQKDAPTSMSYLTDAFTSFFRPNIAPP
uniref:Cse1 domain-containing protein n=1 Tax=Gongylonema pulchrum TaxID=637853 RepID=A0A183EVE8_9BILA